MRPTLRSLSGYLGLGSGLMAIAYVLLTGFWPDPVPSVLLGCYRGTGAASNVNFRVGYRQITSRDGFRVKVSFEKIRGTLTLAPKKRVSFYPPPDGALRVDDNPALFLNVSADQTTIYIPGNSKLVAFRRAICAADE